MSKGNVHFMFKLITMGNVTDALAVEKENTSYFKKNIYIENIFVLGHAALTFTLQRS